MSPDLDLNITKPKLIFRVLFCDQPPSPSPLLRCPAYKPFQIPQGYFAHQAQWLKALRVGGFFATHVKKMIVKMGSSSPIFGVKILKKCVQPPPESRKKTSYIIQPTRVFFIAHRVLGFLGFFAPKDFVCRTSSLKCWVGGCNPIHWTSKAPKPQKEEWKLV